MNKLNNFHNLWETLYGFDKKLKVYTLETLTLPNLEAERDLALKLEKN